MKKLIYLAILTVLMAGCGSSSMASSEEEDSVNIGYGSVTEGGRTTSVSKVKPTKNEIQTYNTIYDYLVGRVPGVQVIDKKIIIRGLGTNSDVTDPLILVDGIELNDISIINPIDVESVEVIKDGSSSIYGMRGANGVILITTKR
ncbi:MAG: TonB-dependent receptor plug domain-containing protein [Bacteroidales bacterium]|nr:TonB-dependent receptor plug domain-containing protein [Bacteroidales bacterium]